MLVLTRKVGEGIFVGDEIKVTVVRVDGRKVRLAIEAPREIGIRREELGLEVREPAVPVVATRSDLQPTPASGSLAV